MLNANKVQDDFENLIPVQYQQIKRRNRDLVIYHSNLQNLKKNAVEEDFVNTARCNILKLIENCKETAKKAVLHKGICLLILFWAN